MRRLATRLAGAFRALLVDPLLRNGHALNLSTALSSLGGLAFWLLVAHRYGLGTVGRNAAAISALMFLGGVAQLNLSSALVRFLPVVERPRALVLGVYATAAGVAVLLSLSFLAVVPHRVPELGFLVSSHWLSAWFVVACASWAVFVLEDGALTGLRRATWVPVENAAFSAAKLVGAIALAPLMPASGIFVAWTACSALTALGTNVFVLGRAARPAAPQVAAGGDASLNGALEHGFHDRSDAAPRGEAGLVAQLLAYVPFDFAGSLCWLIATALLPVVVIARVGAAEGAVVNVCWVLAYALYLASINLGSSLVVETAGALGELAARRSVVRRHLLRLVVPAVVALAVLDRPLLALFGPRYRGSGPLLLDLLAASAIPFVVIATSVAAYRAKRRTRPVAVLNAGLLVVVPLTLALLGPLGAPALGVAWLVAQCLVAGTLLAIEARESRSSSAGHVRRIALPPLWLARAAARVGVPGWIGALVARRSDRATRRLVLVRLPEIVRALGAGAHLLAAPAAHEPAGGAGTADRGGAGTAESGHSASEPASASIRRGDVKLLRGGSDRAVAQLRLGIGEPDVLVKMARSPAGASELERERLALERLHADARLGEWRRLVPCWSPAGVSGPLLAIERVLPGVAAATVIARQPGRSRQVATLGLLALRPLHELTAERGVVTSGDLGRWLAGPIELLGNLHPSGTVPSSQREVLASLEGHLRSALGGRDIELCVTHGDFTPGNVLVGDDGASVTGIVDWSEIRDHSVPALDRALWLVALHCQVSGEQLGSLVSRVVLGKARRAGAAFPGRRRARPGWATSWDAFSALLAPPAAPLPLAELLLWTWLDHVAANLAKSSRYLRSPLWWVSNVEPVLAALATLELSAGPAPPRAFAEHALVPVVGAAGEASAPAARAGSPGTTAPVTAGRASHPRASGRHDDLTAMPAGHRHSRTQP